MKRNDFILMLALIVIAGIFYIFVAFGRENGATAVITVDGTKAYTFSLSEDLTAEIDGYQEGGCTIHISNGEISVTEATCPDRSCVHQGSISYKGDTIACLPNRILIVVDGETSQEYDSIAK